MPSTKIEIPKILLPYPKYREGQNNKVYAGIGSRKAYPRMMDLANEIADYLADNGYTLRHGNALGMDKAFAGKSQPREKNEEGVVTRWMNYNFYTQDWQEEVYTASDADYETLAIARELHPTPASLSPYALNLMARNANQILGKNLDTLVDFVVCWTPDGCESHETRSAKTGGTGQAISIASLLGVPIINLANDNYTERIVEIVKNSKST